jgi:hypothetical protein
MRANATLLAQRRRANCQCSPPNDGNRSQACTILLASNAITQQIDAMGVRRGAFVIAILSIGCSSDEGRRDASAGGSISGITGNHGDTGGGSDDGVAPDSDGGGELGSEGPGSFDLGSADDSPGMDDCAELVEEADVGKQGADIIIVIDNSVSMSNEIAEVQQNMNAFSAQIVAADVDPHVVMISGFEFDSDSGICVPGPLGSGMCPNADHNPPMYWRVDQWVGSHSSLQRVVETYPQYMATIRPDSATHIVVVSDDESDWTPAMFTASFTALDPKFGDYVLHAIVNSSGQVYQQLAMQTGGVIGDLDSGEFQPIFDALADTVIEGASLACSYDIPTPDNGQVFDPDEVNVQFDDGMGGILEIGWVQSATDCAGVVNGWYYDDPAAPTTISLCPQTCDAIQGFTLAKIAIVFGCQTVPAG